MWDQHMYFLCSYVLEAERIVYFFPQFSQPKYIRTVTEGSIEFIKESSKMEQIDDGRDALVILCCHEVMVMKLTGNNPIPPLGKAACKSGDLSATRLI